MNQRHLNLVFPQWQGSWPDDRTLPGARDLVRRYFSHRAYRSVPIQAEASGELIHGIAEYTVIMRQMQTAGGILAQERPDTVFTIGGGCDADLPSVAYLNHRLSGNLALLWLDAHADLNIPATSPTHRFYGMPLRTLLGEGDPAMIDWLGAPLDVTRVVQVGVRDWDSPEAAYLAQSDLCQLSVDRVTSDPLAVIQALRATGCQNVYIHVDLDVLEPSLFPHVPLPAPDGMRPETLLRILRDVTDVFAIPGLGLYEYMPAPSLSERIPLLEEITALGFALPDRWERTRDTVPIGQEGTRT